MGTAAYGIAISIVARGGPPGTFELFVMDAAAAHETGTNIDMSTNDETHGRPGLALREFMDAEAGASFTRPASPDHGPTSISGRLSQYLLAHRPALFCDDCIADRLGLSHRRQANRVTSTLGTSPAFWRDVGACTACGKHKQVIRHV